MIQYLDEKVETSVCCSNLVIDLLLQAMKRAEQYQKQLYRAEEDRRQALATSEALTALWQKKFEKAQNENYDLRWFVRTCIVWFLQWKCLKYASVREGMK